MENKNLTLDDYFKELSLDELKNLKAVIENTQIPNLEESLKNYKCYLEQVKKFENPILAERTYREMLGCKNALRDIKILLFRCNHEIFERSK